MFRDRRIQPGENQNVGTGNDHRKNVMFNSTIINIDDELMNTSPPTGVFESYNTGYNFNPDATFEMRQFLHNYAEPSGHPPVQVFQGQDNANLQRERELLSRQRELLKYEQNLLQRERELYSYQPTREYGRSFLAEELERVIPWYEPVSSKRHENEEDNLSSDPVQESMGQIGKWHIIVCFSLFLLKFPVAWHQVGIIFLAPPVTYECFAPQTDGNESMIKVPNCSENCTERIYDRSIFTETIITQWDLVCEKNQWANISQMIFMFGILVGNMVFGTLADMFGRRGTLVIAVTIQLVSGTGTAFAPTYWLFCVLRFITGTATGGTMITSFVLVMEIIGIKYREIFSIVYQIPFNVGHLLLPLISFLFRDWHHFQLAISIPSVILLSYYWLVPESPRWLFAVGRVDDAAVVLRKAAKRNGLPIANIQANLELAQQLKNKKATVKANFLDLFRTPNLRMKTICMCFNWLVTGLAFFGVAQYIGQLGGDIFVNVAISAAIQLPGTIGSIYFVKRFGRKKTVIFSNSLTGLCMLMIAFFDPTNYWAIIIMSSIACFAMMITYPTIYLYGGELFPTVVRNIGMGTASMCSRIGSIVAPFVASLSSTAHWLPPVIFGATPLMAAAVCLLLPETRDTKLPETIEDGENFGRRKSIA